MSNTIDNTDDVIDSRDVIARIEELEAERDACEAEAFEEWQKSDDADELAALCNLRDEAEGYAPDWHHGAQLIRDSYFETAMDDMLEDCGELPKDLPCYLSITVDYKALQMDYTAVDFDGVTYWVR